MSYCHIWLCKIKGGQEGSKEGGNKKNKKVISDVFSSEIVDYYGSLTYFDNKSDALTRFYF
jgi:hypothetical protein